MARVLVTGGTGVLGSALVGPLTEAGYTVRVMSRHGPRVNLPPQMEWVQADLVTGNGVHEAVADTQIIVHAATTPLPGGKVDVHGTTLLLEAARAAGVAHCFYISIVGIEHALFFYYRHKLKAEALVRESNIPWTILRATQFYPLIDRFLRAVVRGPLMVLPMDLQFQPIDVREVARRIVASLAEGPGGRLDDIGGPEVLRLGEMAQVWLEARRLHRRIVHLPLPGKTAAAFRHGLITCPSKRYGVITWQAWVQEMYGTANHSVLPKQKRSGA